MTSIDVDLSSAITTISNNLNGVLTNNNLFIEKRLNLNLKEIMENCPDALLLSVPISKIQSKELLMEKLLNSNGLLDVEEIRQIKDKIKELNDGDV